MSTIESAAAGSFVEHFELDDGGEVRAWLRGVPSLANRGYDLKSCFNVDTNVWHGMALGVRKTRSTLRRANF